MEDEDGSEGSHVSLISIAPTPPSEWVVPSSQGSSLTESSMAMAARQANAVAEGVLRRGPQTPSRALGLSGLGVLSTPRELEIEGAVSAYFRSILPTDDRRETAPLWRFLEKMPKGADLHNHLTGAIPPSYYLEFAIAKGLRFNSELCAAADGTISATELKARHFSRWFEKITTPLKSVERRSEWEIPLTRCRHFFDSFKYISSITQEMSLFQKLEPVLKEAENHNVSCLELMVTFEISEAEFQTEFRDCSIDMERLHSEFESFQRHPFLQKKLTQFEGEIRSVYALLQEKKHITDRMDSERIVKFIIEEDRTYSLAHVFANLILGMELIRRHPDKLVGINPVGCEMYSTAFQQYDDQNKMIAFLKEKYSTLYEISVNVAFHVGEMFLDGPSFDTRLKKNRMSRAVMCIGPKRLGHAVDLDCEEEEEDYFKLLRERNIAVEACLTSSETLLGRKHPIIRYVEKGVAVVLGTDDAGSFGGITLTGEYYKLATEYPDYFPYPCIKLLARNSLEHSFLPGESLWTGPLGDRYGRIREGFQEMYSYSEWIPEGDALALLERSTKAREQYKLEINFGKFEEDILKSIE